MSLNLFPIFCSTQWFWLCRDIFFWFILSAFLLSPALTICYYIERQDKFPFKILKLTYQTVISRRKTNFSEISLVLSTFSLCINKWDTYHDKSGDCASKIIHYFSKFRLEAYIQYFPVKISSIFIRILMKIIFFPI